MAGSTEPRLTERLSTDPPQQLREALDRLLSARRATGLYQEDHPMAVAARDAAYDSLQQLLREHSRLTLAASEEGLAVNRKVYRQTADSRSFARRLLQRGIRSVSFQPEFDSSELASLVLLLEMDPQRIQAKGGPCEALRAAGVAAITMTEVEFSGVEAEEEKAEPKEAAPKYAGQDELLAIIADYLLGKAEELADETYTRMLDVLREPSDAARLILECVNRADAAALQGGRSAFVTELLQRLESVIIAREPADWEQVKPTVRQALTRLPPALRPKIFAIDLASWETQHAEADSRPPAAWEKVPGLLSQLSRVLAELRSVPDKVAEAMAARTDTAYFAPAVPTAQLGLRKSSLATLLDGMSAMRLPPLPAAREMPDLMEGASGRAGCARAAAVLLEVARRETSPGGYSKLATELEEKARDFTESQPTLALQVVGMFSEHAADANQDLGWRRLRAKAALDAIGRKEIMKIAVGVLRHWSAEHGDTAANLLANLGEPGLSQLADLLMEGLPADSEEAACDAMVRAGRTAVEPLARALESGYASAGLPVVKALARIATPEALQALGRGLTSPDMLVRLGVVQCLGHSGREEAVPLAARALGDGNPSVRRAAITALGELKGQRSVELLSQIALMKSLAAEAVAERKDAVSSLARIGTEEALQTIHAVMRRRSVFRRAAQRQIQDHAAAALNSLGARRT